MSHVFAGLPAKEIHVCGHECAIELVKRVAETAGDTVEVSACQIPKEIVF